MILLSAKDLGRHIAGDPIFQGLAIALMAGSLISMFTAPVLVPLLYFMANNSKADKNQPK